MKATIFLIAQFASLAFYAQVTENKPKLIVGIIVDQMRNDYLFRYQDRYSKGGFMRLMNEGFYGANHHFSYAPTTTGPGHASVYTGSTPAVHGIAGNNWYDPRTKNEKYCVEDKSVKTIGAANADGQMSPKNLRTTTITDELKLLWNMRSKVVGVAIKDRGAILPAGHLGTAYWYSKGDFISSSYYMNALPQWVVAFNKSDLTESYIQAGWVPSFPIDSYLASEPDASPYEGVLAGEANSLLPKDLARLSDANGGGAELLKQTPSGNSLTLEFAKAAIKGESLGEDAITDFLCVSLSSTDYAGHAYGPRALEMEDMYLKLDGEIADFLNHLDRTVGEGAYTVFLTADHGAAEVGTFSEDMNLPGGAVRKKDFVSEVELALAEKAKFIEKVDGNRIFFDEAMVEAAGLDIDQLSVDVARKLSTLNRVYAAYSIRDVLLSGAPSFPLVNLQRGIYPPAAGHVVVVLDSGFIDYGSTGTTHGSPWRYDTHVPLFFYGKGVKPGKHFGETNIRDIAPTISMMFDIPMPSGSTGSPILPVIQR